MPFSPQNDVSPAGQLCGLAFPVEAGAAALRAEVEARLADADVAWKMRLLARDLIDALGPAIEKTILVAGLPARLRRVRTVRITRGVREYGSCNIPRANDGECKLAFSGHLFFPGNADALIDVVAHELLHACHTQMTYFLL